MAQDSEAVAPGPALRTRGPRLCALVCGFSVLAAVLLAVPAIRHWRERPPDAPRMVRAAWRAPAELTLGAGRDFPFGLAISPDGRRAAFPASQHGDVELWLQDLTTGSTRALPGTAGAMQPFWSPDASHIGFFSGGRLKAFDLVAGTVADLAAAPAARGGAWNRAGDIVFAPSSAGGLMRRRADGTVNDLTTIDAASGEQSHRWPAMLDDGIHFVYFASTATGARQGIFLADVNRAEPPRLLTTADASGFAASQTLIYGSGEALVAQPVDVETRALVGRAELLGVSIGRSPQQELLAAVGGDVMVFAPPPSTAREIARFSRDGARTGSVGGSADSFDARIAPDGRRVAVAEVDPQLGTLDVFVYEQGRPVPSLRVSRSTSADESAVWSPDGSLLAWLSERRTLTLRGAGAVLPEHIVARLEPPARVSAWSPDGQWILVSQRSPTTGADIWAVRSNRNAEPGEASAKADAASLVPVVQSAFNDVDGVVSPDGRWIAWASDETGRFEVYVDRFPRSQGRVTVTSGGGSEPRWRRDGRELYFRRGSEIHAVALNVTAGSIDVQSTTRLFTAPPGVRAYDASPDGQWFLVNLPAEAGPPIPATLIVHWQRIVAPR